jgi:hypothetical protein
MPSKLIVVLEKNVQTRRFTCALWADVPLARQPFYAVPGAASVWRGASVAENTAIANGQVAEQVIDLAMGDDATMAQLRVELLIQQQVFQAHINSYNPWVRYGTFYDGTAWTAGGAA